MDVESVYAVRIDYVLQKDKEQIKQKLFDSEIELGAVSGDSGTGSAGGARSSIRPMRRRELSQWVVENFNDGEFDGGYIWFLTQMDGISCVITIASVKDSTVKAWLTGPNKGGLFTMNIRHSLNSVANRFIDRHLSHTTLLRLVPSDYPTIQTSSPNSNEKYQEDKQSLKGIIDRLRGIHNGESGEKAIDDSNRQTVEGFVSSLSEPLAKLGFPSGGYVSVVNERYVLSSDQTLTPRELLYSIELCPPPTSNSPVIQWLDEYMNPLIIYNSIYFLQESHMDGLDKFEDLLERVEIHSGSFWQRIDGNQNANPSLKDVSSDWRNLYNRVTNEQRSIENVIDRIEKADSTPEVSEKEISTPEGNPIYAKNQSLLARLSMDVHKQQERVSEQLEKASIMHEQTTSVLYNQTQTRSAEINRRLQYAVILLTIVTAISAIINILDTVSFLEFINVTFPAIVASFTTLAMLEMYMFAQL